MFSFWQQGCSLAASLLAQRHRKDLASSYPCLPFRETSFSLLSQLGGIREAQSAAALERRLILSRAGTVQLGRAQAAGEAEER